MNAPFYVAGAIALVSTLLVITRASAVHALLYLIVSLLAIAVIFFQLGAPFIAALEVIIYAGAIMVVFVFVVMLLNLGPRSVDAERAWLSPVGFVGPIVLGAILAAELLYVVSIAPRPGSASSLVSPTAVGASLFGPYFLGVELGSFLLLAGLVGALHLARSTEQAAR